MWKVRLCHGWRPGRCLRPHKDHSRIRKRMMLASFPRVDEWFLFCKVLFNCVCAYKQLCQSKLFEIIGGDLSRTFWTRSAWLCLLVSLQSGYKMNWQYFIQNLNKCGTTFLYKKSIRSSRDESFSVKTCPFLSRAQTGDFEDLASTLGHFICLKLSPLTRLVPWK